MGQFHITSVTMWRAVCKDCRLGMQHEDSDHIHRWINTHKCGAA
jgi:hypothetical protein